MNPRVNCIEKKEYHTQSLYGFAVVLDSVPHPWEWLHDHYFAWLEHYPFTAEELVRYQPVKPKPSTNVGRGRRGKKIAHNQEAASAHASNKKHGFTKGGGGTSSLSSGAMESSSGFPKLRATVRNPPESAVTPDASASVPSASASVSTMMRSTSGSSSQGAKRKLSDGDDDDELSKSHAELVNDVTPKKATARSTGLDRDDEDDGGDNLEPQVR